jgi:hypothetical protein
MQIGEGKRKGPPGGKPDEPVLKKTSLFSEYQAKPLNRPGLLTDFGVEVVSFQHLLLWFEGLTLDNF